MSDKTFSKAYRNTLVHEAMLDRIEEVCSVCGSGGHGVVVDIDAVRMPVCRGCIETMFLATHQDEHSFDEYRECPVCSKLARDRGDRVRKVIFCRYRVIVCGERRDAECELEAVVDTGLWQDGYPLPPGWVVTEMESMVDFLVFLCGPCRKRGVRVGRGSGLGNASGE